MTTTARSSLPLRILRAPALHFALAGALLFEAARLGPQVPWAHSAVERSARVIDLHAERVRGLKRDYALVNQRNADQDEVRKLVDNAVTEEILFREAIARGFEQGDRAILWRLVQKMRYLGEDHGDDVGTIFQRAIKMGMHLSDPVCRQMLLEKMRLVVGWSAPRPTDEELSAWYSTHGDEFGQAERLTLRHVFFDRGRRGVDGALQAAEDAFRKAVGQGPEAAAALGGDPFVNGKHMVGQSPGDLGKFFGPDFTKQVLTMPAGHWEGPVESPYGWHLVFIEKRFDPRVPALSEVRSRVEKNYENERRQDRVDEFLVKVRPLYEVRIDESALKGGAGD